MLSRRNFLKGTAASAAVAGISPLFPNLVEAAIHGVAYDTLLVPIMGDSNTGSGEFFDGSLDTTTPTLLQVTRSGGFTPSVLAVAREPLAEVSMGANDIGGTTKLCQLLISGGHVPPFVKQIIMVPAGIAGTGLNPAENNAWNVNSGGLAGRQALDGGSETGGTGNGLYGMLNQALSFHPTARIWFFVWIEGANDGGMTQGAWTSAAQALFSEIRGLYPSGALAPILFTGIPPNRVDPLLGGQVNLGGVIAAHQNIAANLSGAIYIDPNNPTVLQSYLDNGFVHFCAASHRGGTDNSNTNLATSIASGSYNSGTGVVTLTLSADVRAEPGSSITVAGVTGTGSFASCNGSFTAGTGTNGTTLNYTISTGLTLTITNSATGTVTNVNGWFWNALHTYANGDHTLGSDNFCYLSIASGNIGNDPTTDGGVHWTKTSFEYGLNVTDTLATRSLAALLSTGIFQ